ncbi:NAD-dependent epimerase/dehydratase family protein [Aquirufa sp.]|jgi:UDP-glucose 4-epimerase|uniref:NAD-dependent epimerase/dehydratase family protein n=1 Tax=Aquirufa sp. TaxID=2676249 RepID=UPI0037BF2D42
MDKILVVGGAGFLGYNLLDYVQQHLQNDALELVVLSQDIPESSIYFPDVLFVEGDYSDVELLTHLFENHQFTHVFHFASSIIPALSTHNIQRDVETNLLPTIGLMEVMKAFACKNLVYLSSGGAVYGNELPTHKKESQACQPISSYGIIKLAVEHYIRLYANLYQIDYLILRLSNPFGLHHRSSTQGVINIAIRKALRGETLVVWGDGTQAKDYLFASDISRAIMDLFKAQVKNQTLNIGSGQTISVLEIIALVKSKVPHFQVEFMEAMPTDVQQVSLDISQLRKHIPFELTPLAGAFEKTFIYEQVVLANEV